MISLQRGGMQVTGTVVAANIYEVAARGDEGDYKALMFKAENLRPNFVPAGSSVTSSSSKKQGSIIQVQHSANDTGGWVSVFEISWHGRYKSSKKQKKTEWVRSSDFKPVIKIGDLCKILGEGEDVWFYGSIVALTNTCVDIRHCIDNRVKRMPLVALMPTGEGNGHMVSYSSLELSSNLATLLT